MGEKKEKIEKLDKETNNFQLTTISIVTLVALVALVSVVALVMNAGVIKQATAGTLSTVSSDDENMVGDAGNAGCRDVCRTGPYGAVEPNCYVKCKNGGSTELTDKYGI